MAVKKKQIYSQQQKTHKYNKVLNKNKQTIINVKIVHTPRNTTYIYRVGV